MHLELLERHPEPLRPRQQREERSLRIVGLKLQRAAALLGGRAGLRGDLGGLDAVRGEEADARAHRLGAAELVGLALGHDLAGADDRDPV